MPALARNDKFPHHSIGERHIKENKSTILLILVFVAGLSLLLYPTAAKRWNGRTQSRAIASYSESVAKLDTARYDELWQAAEDYNQTLTGQPNRYLPTDDAHRQYLDCLDVSGSGVMGYIDIPDINVSLPIYHTTSPLVLQVAVGHMEESSLPTGGPGTHIALSGHRGLPSAKLFTDLDQMEVGQELRVQMAVRPAMPEEEELTEEAETPELDGDTYLGVLSVPALGLELPVMTEWSYPKLKKTPAAMWAPSRGENLVITAHNYRSNFGTLDQLPEGSEVVLETVDGDVLRYQVSGKEVPAPTAIGEMTAGDMPLTLFTCTYGGAGRFTLRCDWAA